MVRPGASRQQLARTLNAAYADGLLSERTLAWRLDMLFANRLIDPAALVGDLITRARLGGSTTRRLRTLISDIRRRVAGRAYERPVLLALDWSGAQEELLVGRHPACDIAFSSIAVSRRHARLVFRDCSWIVQDLGSTNGTTVNYVRVGRCQLHPGDLIAFGDQRVRID